MCPSNTDMPDVKSKSSRLPTGALELKLYFVYGNDIYPLGLGK